MASRRAIIRASKTSAPAGRPTAAPQGAQPYFGAVSPVAMQNDVQNGYAYTYGNFLPRPPGTFTQGAFGPFSPILPVPVDTPTESGRAEPRREQYEVGWDLPVGEPGTEGIKLATFPTLRTLADLYSVARACIQTRKSEVRGLEWDIMPTADAAKANKGNEKWFRDFGQRRAQAMKFFRRPDPDYFSWNTFIDAFLEEIFVFDALSLYLRPKRGKGMKKGLLGSDLDSLELLSGPTIRPLYGIHGEYPRPPSPAYQQYLYGVPRSDFMRMITDKDIEDAGMAGSSWGQFRGDQLLYLPMTPRRWTPYGFPPIERALIPVMSGLQKQGYALDFFREGTVPAVYISPGDATMTPNQIRELQDALNAFAGDPAFHHKIIVLPAGSKTMPQRDAQLADQFDEVIMNQVCCVPGTEIVTKRGLIDIENVVVGDEVVTHTGRWRRVIATMTNPVHTPVREITAKGFESLHVTGNHRVWAARYTQSKTNKQSYEESRWVHSRDLTVRRPGQDFDALTMPQIFVGNSDATLDVADLVCGTTALGWKAWEDSGIIRHERSCVVPLPATVPMNAALGRLVGFFAAEGTATPSKTGQFAWCFHKNEVAYQQQVIDDLKTVFGVDAKVRYGDYRNPNAMSVYCNHALLAQLFFMGKSSVRKLPSWVWNGSPEFLESLLWAWISGDGTFHSDRWNAATVSKSLAWQMRLIAVSCGYEASIITCKQSSSDFGRPGYVAVAPKERSDGDFIYRVRAVTQKSTGRRGTYRIDGAHLTSPVKSNELSAYNGDIVYNLSVEDDHSYLTTGGMISNCMAFDVMPMELGISPKVSTTMSPGASNQMAKMTSNTAERKSTKPLLAYICDIMNQILQNVCGQDDMSFVFEGLEEEEDQEQLTNLLTQQVNIGIRSIDEARDELNLQPWGLPETSGPVYLSPTGPIPFGSVPLTQAPAPGTPGAPGGPPAPKPGEAQVGGGSGENGAGPAAPPGKPKPKPSGPSGGDDTPGHAAAEAADSQEGRQASRAGMASGVKTGQASEKPNEKPASAPDKKSTTSTSKFTITTGLEKAVDNELEALGRHLLKGRQISTWVPKNVPQVTLACISQQLAKGLPVDVSIRIAKTTTLAPPAAPPQPAQAQTVPPPPATTGVDWAGWVKDAALADLYTHLITGAFHKSFSDVAQLGAGVLNGSVAVTRQVLKGLLHSAISSHVGPVLQDLWHEAWFLGDRAGQAAVTKSPVNWGTWELGQPATAPHGETAHVFEKTVLGPGLEVANGIADTRLDQVAQAIRDAASPEELSKALDDLLNVSNRAHMIAQTETTRLSSFAALNRYGIAGVMKIEWNVEPGACAVCKGNAAQDPIPVGDVFKSGAAAPPQHPRCRCSIEPMAFAGDLTKGTALAERRVALNGQEAWYDPYNAAGGGGQSPVRHWGDGTQAPDGVPVTGGVPGSSAGGEFPRWDTPVANGYQGGLNDLSQGVNPAQGHDSGNDANQPYGISHQTDVNARSGVGVNGNGADRWPSGQTQTEQPPGVVNAKPGDDPIRGSWGTTQKATGLIAAGIAVLAESTGRVLMLQRAMSDDDPAAGFWEFPGGCLEPGENALQAAKREWQEEVGVHLPAGTVTNRWDASNGKYVGFVYTVPDEDGIPLFDGRRDVPNPDDPDRDDVEAVAWWDPGHLAGNAAVRPELKSDLDDVLDALGRVTKAATGYLDGPLATVAEVRDVMAKNFPAAALAWLNDASWHGPMPVPLADIDFSGEKTWAAGHEIAHDNDFVQRLRDGEKLNPIILIDTPKQHDFMIVDGHHRALAYRKLGENPVAYVGTTTKPTGPWDETHSSQLSQGAKDANKSTSAEKIGPKGYTHGWVKVDQTKPNREVFEGHGMLHSKTGDKTFSIRHENRSGYGRVTATDQHGNEMGSLQYAPDLEGNGHHVTWLETKPELQRQGLATVLFNEANQRYGVHHQDLAEVNIQSGNAFINEVKSAETPALAATHHPLGTHGLWGDRSAQLPAYIQNIAHAMIKDGHDESSAISLAIGAVKRWAVGEGKVTPEVQAAATAALAEWEKLKAEHSKTKAAGADIVKVGPHGYVHGWIKVGLDTDKVKGAQEKIEKIANEVLQHGPSHPTVPIKGISAHLTSVHSSGAGTAGSYNGDKQHINVYPISMQPTDPDPAGYHVPHGNSDMLKYALTHEYGHHLAENLTGQQQQALLDELNKELKFQKFGNTVKSNDFNGSGTKNVEAGVSRYGAENKQEMLAELYAESQLSPNPRPAAQIVARHIAAAHGEYGAAS